MSGANQSYVLIASLIMEYETQWSSGLPNGQMGKKTSIGLYYSWNGGRAEAVCAGENE
jgi:hypothetical protein